MAEILETGTDDWWVMGDARGNYVRWKGDGVPGRYVQTCDAEDAERFGTKEEAMREIATPLVQDDLDWGGGEILPLHVEKRIDVSADL